MKKFLILLFSSSLCGYHFNLKWNINDGVDWYISIPKGADTDHDELKEIIFFSESLNVSVIYELNGNEFNLEHIIDPSNHSYFWGVGDYDGDALSDALIQHWLGYYGQGSYLRVYESPLFYSYPDSAVWGIYLYNINIGEGFYIRSWGDLDGDDKKDIFVHLYKYFWIFENIGDNQYELVLFDSLSPPRRWDLPTAGEFDGDNKTDIVDGGMYGEVSVFENTGDNQYELVWETDLPSGNAYDNFSVDDADQDGKPEFVIHAYSYAPPCCKQSVWIFEATGDNTYEVVYLDTIRTPWTNVQGPISDAGDVDGDGVPELVISGTTAWYILKATEDNQYERIFYHEPNPPEGWLIQLDIELYDLDDNGLNEVITSWTWVENGGWLHAKTEIFEKGIDMEWVYPSLSDTFWVDSVETLRWVVYDTISVESLYIYLTPLSNQPRDLIFVGEPLTDTHYNWTVPDSLGEFKLWLIVTGPGRRDSIKSPIIYITPTGVEEKGIVSRGEGLLILPSNPVKSPIKIKYFLRSSSKKGSLQIVDVAGRVIRTFRDLKPGSGSLIWYGLDDRSRKVSKGIYFILLEREGKRWLRKIILLR